MSNPVVGLLFTARTRCYRIRPSHFLISFCRLFSLYAVSFYHNEGAIFSSSTQPVPIISGYPPGSAEHEDRLLNDFTSIKSKSLQTAKEVSWRNICDFVDRYRYAC
jgi:hypothetical protein